MTNEEINVIPANWHAPSNIVAFTTTRIGGISPSPYQSLNLGVNNGDALGNVQENRQRLIKQLALPSTPAWLTQTHETHVIEVTSDYSVQEADASYTRRQNTICTVLTADCMPILLTNKAGTEVAAIHAGWRSLIGGVIKNTVQRLDSRPEDILAWIGPCIHASAYKVDSTFRNKFLSHHEKAKEAFTRKDEHHWQADLPQLAQLHLNELNINRISLSPYCTTSCSELFYSYRRDGDTGRMASVIYIKKL